MNVLVGLTSPDASGEGAQAAAEYVPGSGSYHQFLSPSEVAARYAPDPSTVASAVAYFTLFGLTAVPLSGGSLLSVSGTNSRIGAAFGTSFDTYLSEGGRTFVSHATPAVLPEGLPWAGAYGLGNATPLTPLAIPLDDPSPVAGPAAACSEGTDGLSPCQIWGAYNASGLIANGTDGSGVRIGVVDAYDGSENATRLNADLGQFDSAFSLAAPTVTYNYPVPGPADLNTSSTNPGWALEEALDLEWSHASAPGASIAMTFSPNSGAGLYEAVDWLVSNHLVDVISLSWGEPDVGEYNSYAGGCASACNASSDGSYEILGGILEAAALEGISVFAASGDCGSADGTNGVSTNYPSSDPFITGVGGTVLSVSPTGSYISETAWSGNATGRIPYGCTNQGGSGGGFAPFPRPWWQQGTGVPRSPSARGDPDVSDDAATPVEVFEDGNPTGVGGTSVATPLWAGVTAIADQFAGSPRGFLDPGLYSILRGPNYALDFHNITIGNNGAYSAHAGWNAVTGIGTPNVAHLITDLARSTTSVSSLDAYLVAGPGTGAAPLTVHFYVSASGGSDAYPLEDVDFGDGTSAVVHNGTTSHVYTADGVYAAIGYVVDSSGNVSDSEPFPIVVGGGAALEVNLTASTTTPAVGAPVLLTTTVHGGTAPYSYTYSYGDGTFLNWTSSDTESHAYPVVGGFCAEVVVRDSASPLDGGASAGLALAVGGSASPTCVNDSSSLTVVANADPGIRDAPADYPSLFQLVGGFEGSGSGSFTEQLSSTDPYISVCGCTIFRAPGNYSVTLNATDPIGGTASNETNVTVAPPLVGTFTTSPTFGPAPWKVDFAVSVAGGHLANASRTSWSFGNGVSTTGASVSETYSTPGIYFATGDVSDGGHGNASEGILVDVLPASDTSTPVVTATIAPVVNITSGATVNFSAESVLPDGDPIPVQFNWSLWNGASSLGALGAATFEAPAGGEARALNFWLNATWPSLGTHLSIPVDSPSFLAVEAAGFVPRTSALAFSASGGPDAGFVPLPWNGTAAASGPGMVQVGWVFGPGREIADENSVNVTYPSVGNYTANATALDSWGDTAELPFGTVARSNSVPTLSVRATVSTLRGLAPLTVNFSANASGGTGAPYTFNWVFGDGTHTPEASAQHTYTVVGNYSVSLTVSDSGNAPTQENWTIEVTANATSAPGNRTATAGFPTVDIVAVGALFGVVLLVAVLASVRRRSPPPPTP